MLTVPKGKPGLTVFVDVPEKRRLRLRKDEFLAMFVYFIPSC